MLKINKIGLLFIIIVFGILIVGCAILSEIGANLSTIGQAPPTDDGKGGIVIVTRTDDVHYWYVSYTDGSYTERDVLNNNPVSVYELFSFETNIRNDSTFTILYRPMTDLERIGGYGQKEAVERVIKENKRNWQRKTVYVSNDQTVRISIP